MTVKTQIESLTKPTSIALGVFDGVHIGHQAVIGEAVNGEADGLMPVVFTFDTGGEKPEHKKGQETILTTSLKRKKMEELGVSVIYEIPFDTVKDYSPEYFAEHFLVFTAARRENCLRFRLPFRKKRCRQYRITETALL